jgi:hypothetical protein
MTKNQKEFGKLTTEQFKSLIQTLPEIRKESSSLAEAVRNIPEDRFNEMLKKDFYWALVYELSFVEHLSFLLLALDKLEFIKSVSKSADPTKCLLDSLETDDDYQWNGGWNGLFDKQDLVGLVYSLQRTILSIMIYQKTLNQLVEEVRQGLDDSLFDAVRLDRSIVAAPTIAARIARAELRQDKRFFERLRSAIKGPSQKHWEAYKDLRFALYTLRDLGFDNLTDDQLVDLLVNQLKVYPDTFGAKKNLRKQYNQSRKLNHLK